MKTLLALHCIFGVLDSVARAAAITTTTRQPVNGFGASGAWWTIDLWLFPEAIRTNVSQLLLNQTTGLGLTDYRYNLGGGGVGVGTWDRAPETPYVSDGVYNFSADPQGTYFLREAARQGVPMITLFINSAPITMTNSSRNCGGTLITDRIPAYAKYITDVVSYWATQGVHITNVSPMNEPDNNFSDGVPTDLCGQEGMQVTPQQRAEVVTTIAAALKNASLTTKVISDESSSTGNFFADAPIWLSPTVGADLIGVSHHQYGFANDAQQVELGQLARNLSGGTPSWFTEICCYVETNSTYAEDPLSVVTYGSKYDPTMVSALRMANLIYQSLTDAEDEHWDWWTALSNEYGCDPLNNATCVNTPNYEGWDDGLIYYNAAYNTTGDYSLTLTKRYSVLRHFTKGVPIGSVRRNVISVETNWRVLAFDSPAGSESPSSCGPYSQCQGSLYSVVAFNAQWSSSTLTLEGRGIFTTEPVKMYRTSPSEDYVELETPRLRAGRDLVIEAPPMSIYTIFF